MIKEKGKIPGGDAAALDYINLSPDEIRPSPLNPRKRFDEEPLSDLMESIRLQGVLQPVGVRESAGGYELIWGERRWRACRALSEEGVKVVLPAAVRNLSDEEVFELQVTENLRRQDLTISEEARAYETMIGFGRHPKDVAKRFQRSEKHVVRYLKLLELPPPVLKRLDLGRDDPERLPLFAAAEAVRVGEKDRLKALAIAEEAGSESAARKEVERQFIRPAQERAEWEARVEAGEQKNEPEGNMKYLSFDDSRALFPTGIVSLTAITAGDYALASARVPEDLLNDHCEDDVFLDWESYADQYDAPIYVACDGEMATRRLVKPAEVMSQAIVFHTFVGSVVEGFVSLEGGYALSSGLFCFYPLEDGEFLPREGDTNGLKRWSPYQLEGGRLPVDLPPSHVDDDGRPIIFYARNVGACPFRCMSGSALPTETPGSVAIDHRHDSESEPAPVANETDRREELRGMLSDMAAQIRVADRTARQEVLATRAAADLVELAIASFDGNHNPYVRLLDLLEIPEEGDTVMSGWLEFDQTWAGFASASVCAWILYWVEQTPEAPPSECRAWTLALEVFG